jgi:hypothetical protein
MSLEYCCECSLPTGNAGKFDGSFYCDDDGCGDGPFCEACCVFTEEEIFCLGCAERRDISIVTEGDMP